jgi:hypothetical protein
LIIILSEPKVPIDEINLIFDAVMSYCMLVYLYMRVLYGLFRENNSSSIPDDKGEEKIWIIIIITIVHYQKKIYKNWKKQNWFEPEKVKW